MRSECGFQGEVRIRGKVIAIPKSSRPASSNEGGRDSGMRSRTYSDIQFGHFRSMASSPGHNRNALPQIPILRFEGLPSRISQKVRTFSQVVPNRKLIFYGRLMLPGLRNSPATVLDPSGSGQQHSGSDVDSRTQFVPAGSRQSAASTKLTHGSLFSGVGGIDLGFGWAGIETVWQVEYDPFARKVLEKRYPNVPKFTDVRECGEHNLKPVDIISGGFPCQDESISGKKRGLGTPENPTKRSGLWYQYLRIIRELRPPWALIENVSRLLHSGDIDIVLSGMEEIGYTCWSLLLAAEILGAPHKRERVWILCHRNDAHDSRDFGAADDWSGGRFRPIASRRWGGRKKGGITGGMN